MTAIRNIQILPVLEFGVRDTIKRIADQYEAENGRKNSAKKLFIYIDPAHQTKRVEAIKAGDKAKARIFAAAIGVVGEDGKVDFNDPQLNVLIMKVMGNSKNRNVKNVELDGVFVTSYDTAAPKLQAVQLYSPTTKEQPKAAVKQVEKAEASEDAPEVEAPKKRRSKKAEAADNEAAETETE